MRSSRLVLLALLAAAGCSNDLPNLTVDLETDLVPGIDFDQITVEVAPPTYNASSLAPGAVTTTAMVGSYVPGRRVAEIHGVQVGDHLVRVRLIDRDGTMVVQRLVRLQIQSTYSLIVIVTRDCAGITCPQPDGDPTFTSCVSGVCTNPTCSPATPEACPHPACTVAADCTPSSECVHPVCDEGQCLQVAVDTACPAGQRCDATLGCVLPTGVTPDAGLGDACPSTEIACTNGMDDDCDGHADCADTDCAAATCDDGHVCTTTDQCAGGVCAGTALSCDDGVACTVDTCAEPMGCTHVPSNALCTVMPGGTCDAAHDCQYPTCTTASCVASDPCDVATCVGSTCTHAPVSCAAGSSCCGGTCHATACDDGNACTNDSFSTTTCACVHTNNANTCNDGSACTTGDHCAAGRCTGTARNCDDSNACTTDGCSAASGCTHTGRANGTSCSGGACCGGSCVALSTRTHCGSCGATCASGQSCVTVPGRSGVHTCTCTSNPECRGEGFGGMATCFSGYCDCQCAAAEPTTCSGQCSSGATCHELSGHNYCQYP
jgi:hypothetical protein